ncbi:MAG: hypothetical protein DHS20C21_16980 [Gemmatimonadota bacterium]|nr:MAG: hypothetical protein DHS20C21_16980 [Gemmatimonadota bacterium]
MLRPLGRFMVAVALAASATAYADAPAAEPEFRVYLDQLQESGEFGYEQALLLRFQRVFAPERLPARHRSGGAWPAKSATLLIHEFDSVRSGISPEIFHEIDGMLGDRSRATEIYATEHFRISFDRDGVHAVPAPDLDASGIPDHVERVGAWAETAWQTLVQEDGFATPLTTDGRLDISFRQMSAYGYTDVRGGVPALVLHRNFEGFPANSDPQGSAYGAAKVTVAHELKHAIQYASSGWSEGGWLEADATWAEDRVFPATNDYVRYLPFGSPVSHPADWMPVSYEDCLWQQVVAGTEGVDALVRFFERRSANRAEPVLVSFDETLRAGGSSLSRALETLGLWSYFSGANATDRPVGFADADRFPTPPLRALLATAGDLVTDDLAPLGTHHVIVFPANRGGRPEIAFLADLGTAFSLNGIVTHLSGARTVHSLPMVSPNSSAAELPVFWEDVASVVLVASSLSLDSPSRYSMTVNALDAVGVRELETVAELSLDFARPNPFRDRTTIAFSLGASGPVRLAIYDVAGRLVKSLHDGTQLESGSHEAIWNGLDQAGRLATPGMYYYRLEAGSSSASHRVLLLR